MSTASDFQDELDALRKKSPSPQRSRAIFSFAQRVANRLDSFEIALDANRADLTREKKRADDACRETAQTKRLLDAEVLRVGEYTSRLRDKEVEVEQLTSTIDSLRNEGLRLAGFGDGA